MATNLDLDDSLIEEARSVGGHATKRAAVTAALKEYVHRRKGRQIGELFGQLEYWPDYDYKAARGGLPPPGEEGTSQKRSA